MEFLSQMLIDNYRGTRGILPEGWVGSYLIYTPKILILHQYRCNITCIAPIFYIAPISEQYNSYCTDIGAISNYIRTLICHWWKAGCISDNLLSTQALSWYCTDIFENQCIALGLRPWEMHWFSKISVQYQESAWVHMWLSDIRGLKT